LFNIYPNPTSGHFTLEFKDEDCSEAFRIEIYNLVGKQVYKRERVSSQKLDINLSSHSQGLFIIKTICGDKVFTKKLIKN